jgi:hypothetical protein
MSMLLLQAMNRSVLILPKAIVKATTDAYSSGTITILTLSKIRLAC